MINLILAGLSLFAIYAVVMIAIDVFIRRG